MKMELGSSKPNVLKESWPGEYDIFSWMEYTCAIAQPMFLITTYKEGQIPNVCFHAWSTFVGEGDAYYCILALLQSTHTYDNIMREKCFCINFPHEGYLKNCYDSIQENTQDRDEIFGSGFTSEDARTVPAPRIKECFLNLECRLEWAKDLFPNSQWVLLCGRVEHLAADDQFVKADAAKRVQNFSFMYNIHAPNNPLSGEKHESRVARLQIMDVQAR